MSASRNVVERFLSLVRRRRFDRLAEVLDDEFVMIAPDTTSAVFLSVSGTLP